jgi:P27 family predicted phage terminase small subunit
MRGRKPKPTALKELHGSDQPINPDEPIPTGKLTDDPTDSPEHFTPEQRAAWEEILRHSAPGMVKRIDGYALEQFVVALCLHRQATRMLNGESPVIDGRISPVVAVINTQTKAMAKWASELGFTPVSRPRIHGGPAADVLRPSMPERDAPQKPLKDFLASAPRAQAIH